ncbi:hypothetical protein BV898_17059 [Hypsibius exemplaris]|uniref:G-protein coupled receptors family 1 profile domain-containing protein n=1 Tax=Hypsibius exemplaris TaxID=2072580 RepID=A0A9X6RMG5_HYPEX|nr:hypothetical protein BV898_17059 [Hypsibius exemplaris]
MFNSSAFNWSSSAKNISENNQTAWRFHSERSSLTVWFATFVAFSLFGILTNGILFSVIIRSRALRSGAGLLILHVLANGFVENAVHNPIHGILIYGDNVWFVRPHGICTYVHVLMGFTQFANNWAEASLAVNRLVAVIFPFAYKVWSTRKVTGMMIVLSWLISVASYLPNCFGVGGQFYATEQGQCTVQIFNKFGSFLVAVAVYVPYGIVGIITVFLFLFMYVRGFGGYRGRGAPWRPGSQQDVLYRRRLTVTNMLLMSFLFDVMCAVPLPIFLASFPSVYAGNPLLRLWLRSCLALQYPITPVMTSHILKTVSYLLHMSALSGDSVRVQ